ncbi:hypothetical protein EVAR_97655_1 [Eumeta japonica]|uniref:Uncharacterized protein n=1 Tax=Eumeta variegata TaxID=151549 RepID=A0A4C1WZ10_EUMVA|nr:hypothetical protein EVAR_97655_1 [Eumeta japonica]
MDAGFARTCFGFGHVRSVDVGVVGRLFEKRYSCWLIDNKLTHIDVNAGLKYVKSDIIHGGASSAIHSFRIEWPSPLMAQPVALDPDGLGSNPVTNELTDVSEIKSLALCLEGLGKATVVGNLC